jgi:hypothetical protein
VATEIERAVLDMLSAIEPPGDAAERIEALGPEAVDVACDAALGTYVGLRPKVRTNAAAIVGRMHGEQALQTLALLVTDPSDDVAIRALRAVGRRDEPDLVARAALVLRRPGVAPLVAVEAVDALAARTDSPLAAKVLVAYREATGADAMPHRRSQVVEQALARHAR